MDIDQAEQVSSQIQEWKEKEILFQNLLIVEENERDFQTLKSLNQQQIQDFEIKWSEVIQQLKDLSEKVEQ